MKSAFSALECRTIVRKSVFDSSESEDEYRPDKPSICPENADKKAPIKYCFHLYNMYKWQCLCQSQCKWQCQCQLHQTQQRDMIVRAKFVKPHPLVRRPPPPDVHLGRRYTIPNGRRVRNRKVSHKKALEKMKKFFSSTYKTAQAKEKIFYMGFIQKIDKQSSYV